MSDTYITADLRRLVRARARGRCEYCLIAEEDTIFGCEIDHVIAEKHGGVTVSNNLAYACASCNGHKGSDLGSIATVAGELVRFYNPRIDRWSEHFVLDAESGVLHPLTDIGAVTAKNLRFNAPEQRRERKLLREIGNYLLPGEELQP